MGRAPCCDKANVKRGPWSSEEDAKLKAYIEQYGTGGNWIALPQKIGLKRCGKSCRLRWLNYLRPNIKHGGFSEEEDNIICNLFISIGSRWSIIAAQLPGRTDNDIKNYWNTRLKKKLLGRRKQSNNITVQLSPDDQTATGQPKDANSMDDTQSLSNSALERILLHMQLQGLQNPMSFHNNPALWPKLHPFREKMIQTLQSLNENPYPALQSIISNISSQSSQEQKGMFEPPTANSVTIPKDYANPKVNETEGAIQAYIGIGNVNQVDSTGCVPKEDGNLEQSNNTGFNQVSTFQDERDACLTNKTVNFTTSEDQIAEFDCFKEMGGSKDNLIWWSNDLDMNSASSNSWDSASVLQDYELGYNL